MLWRALGQVPGGFYVDLGAHSPVTDSVTKVFYDAGWSGLNVEPEPAFFAELERARPRDRNLQVAVADFEGAATLFTVPGTGLSTLDDANARAASGQGFATETAETPVTTLERIWQQHIPQGQPVHFLKIDVEGSEYQVIRATDWTALRPWILLVEATEPNSPRPNHFSWEPILTGQGYEFCWFDGLNRFYIAAERKELHRHFTHPPCVFDNFITAREADLIARLERHRLSARAKRRLRRTAAAAGRLGVRLRRGGAGDT